MPLILNSYIPLSAQYLWMFNSHFKFTMYKTEFLISPKPAACAVFPISANGYFTDAHAPIQNPGVKKKKKKKSKSL